MGSRFTQADVNLGKLSYGSETLAIPIDGAVQGIQGSQIVFSRSDGDMDLFLYDGSTGVTAQLTNNNVNDEFLKFNGTTVVWSSRLDTIGTELFVYNTATKQTKQLTDSRTEVPTFQDAIGSKVFWNNPGGSDRRLNVYDTANPNAQVTPLGDKDTFAIQFIGSKVFYRSTLSQGNRIGLTH